MSSVVVAGDRRAVMKLLRMVMRNWYLKLVLGPGVALGG